MISNKLFFVKKSEMTSYAEKSGLEMVRCKQTCAHVAVGRPAILLIKDEVIVVKRLVQCKVCANAKKGGLL